MGLLMKTPSDKLILQQVNALLKLYGQPTLTKQQLLCDAEKDAAEAAAAEDAAGENPTELPCLGGGSGSNAMLKAKKHYE
jgi:hypothetical protein